MAHILVIDDEVAMRTLISDALASAGYVVSQAANGREGMEKIHADSPDLIITDIVMPLLDGIELILSLWRQGCKVPLIAMTGIPPEAVPYLRIARSLGAIRTLAKPFRMPELVKVAKEVLAERTCD